MKTETSDTSYCNILNSIKEAVVCEGRNGEITFVNEYGKKFLGLGEKNVIGEKLENFLEIHCRSRFNKGESLLTTVSFKSPKHRVLLRSTPLKTESGDQIGVTHILSNLDHKSLSLADTILLVSNALEPSLQVNLEGEIVACNKLAEKRFGYAPGELINKHLTALIPSISNKDLEDDLQRFHDSLNAMKEGKAKTVVIKRKNGEEKKCELTWRFFGVEPHSIVLSANNIGKTKKIEADLRKKNRLLEFAERMILMGHWQWMLPQNQVIWSNNLYKMFGHKFGQELTYETYFGYVHPDDKEYVTLMVNKSIEDKKFHHFFHRILLADGTVKVVHLLGELFVNSQNEVVEMVGTCQDVTKQKSEEAKFKSLLESAPDAMVIVDENGKIFMANKQAERIFGYSASEFESESIEKLIPNRYSTFHRDHMERFFMDPRPREMGHGKELFGRHKNNYEFPVEISLSPIELEDGRLVSAAIRDISLRKKEAAALAAKNVQLTDFCNIVSHNLRGPLVNIGMLLDYIDDCEQLDEKFDGLKKVRPVVDHLNEIFDELVESIQIQQDSEVAVEEIDLVDCLESVLTGFQSQIAKYEVQLSFDFKEAQNVRFPRKYMDSILSNLISNALKYKSPDRKPVVRVRTRRLNDCIVLSVSDNGLGLDVEMYKDQIFKIRKIFHNHPEARGFGLFMTKTQVEAMGGEIWVESVPGDGSTFFVKIASKEF